MILNPVGSQNEPSAEGAAQRKREAFDEVAVSRCGTSGTGLLWMKCISTLGSHDLPNPIWEIMTSNVLHNPAHDFESSSRPTSFNTPRSQTQPASVWVRAGWRRYSSKLP